jgi:tetratricopeptide (TPR) repeat protein
MDYIGCPNGHLIHRDCLKMWLLKQKDCPVCHTPYEGHIISIFDEFIAQYKKDQELKLELQKKAAEDAKKAAEEAKKDPEFEEAIRRVNKMISEQNYTGAMNLLWDLHDTKYKNEKDPIHHRILMELGKLYILIEKHSLAITQLMKLVRLDYNYPFAFFYLGKAYDAMGQPDRAVWAFERAEVVLKKSGECGDEGKVCEDFLKTRLAKKYSVK